MVIDKFHKRSIVGVLEPDTEERMDFCIEDARVNSLMVTWNLLKEADLRPGDELTVDVRILVKRK